MSEDMGSRFKELAKKAKKKVKDKGPKEESGD